MYINVENLLKIKNPLMLPFLLLLKQVPKKDLTEELASLIVDDDSLNWLMENQYVKVIKGKKSDNFISLLRLDKKGNSFLNSLSEVEIEEQDKKMFNYLCEMYLKHEDEERHIGNKKKTLIYCTEFRLKMDLGLYQMYWLCWFFLQEHSFTKKLEYIFFNSNKNRYGKFKDNIEDSPLYQFYDTRKEDVKALWSKKIT